MKRRIPTFFFAFFPVFFSSLLFSTSLGAMDYKADIEGVSEKELLSSLKGASQTIGHVKKKPVTSLQILRKRAEADITKMNDVCHYYGYLQSDISFTIERSQTPKVVFNVLLGPLYTIKEFELVSGMQEEKLGLITPFKDITLKEIGIKLNMPACTRNILKAEEKALLACKKRGYAFCKGIKKQAVADGLDHTLSVTFFIDTGPRVVFGKTKMHGLKTIHSEAIDKYIAWQEDEVYSPETVEKTHARLEKSGLFTSIKVNEQHESFQDGKLDMSIGVDETKHRSIATGLSYMTTKGPGVACKWEDRNIRGQAEKLAVNCDLWWKFQTVTCGFRQPHYNIYEQDRLFLLKFDRQDTIAYFSQEVSFSTLLVRKFTEKTEGSWGGKLESLHSDSIDGKATYYLAKVPLYLKWQNVKNPTDPVKGQTLHVRLTPSYQIISPDFFYLNHTTTALFYRSILEDAVTFAVKAVFGNIFGASKHTIPPPDRFFAGSESILRGYRYLTVSPLNKHDKPTGGRSLLAGSLEMRLRTGAQLGWVAFYDVGNVYTANFPILDEKFLHSVGLGARYSTPLGPLRLDIALPLNRRHRLDPPFQIYFSIGQAF